MKRLETFQYWTIEFAFDIIFALAPLLLFLKIISVLVELAFEQTLINNLHN